MPNDELLLELDGMLRKVDWFQYKWLSFDKKDRHYLIREILAKLKAMGWKSPEEYRAILSRLIHEVQHTRGDELNKLLDCSIKLARTFLNNQIKWEASEWGWRRSLTG